ncbi:MULTISPECIES: hypothetical protein [unclassified Nocardiopsis]|uniref:hypothetical protein n=1 Tax=unclassified Nocardiopsis TaxID=2649073 RepID=UPI0033D92F60
MTAIEGAPMRREDAYDALERARLLDARIRPRGRWYTLYGVVFGLTSAVLLLIVGITGTVTGVVVGLALYAAVLGALIVYSVRQPVKPLDYARLHNWGMAGWTLVYTVAIVAGSVFFRGEPLWWVPMAVLSAVPTTVVGLVVLRRSGRGR